VRHSVLNAEAFTAILFLLASLIRIRPVLGIPAEVGVSDRLLGVLIAAVTLIAFIPALAMPLLHDSYGHIYTASRESFVAVLQTFAAHPQHGDFFFRPLGYLAFWLDWKWAGFSPFRWHAWSVLIHVVNCLLVFTLARQLGLGKLAAFFGALLFALHGSRPEAVAWVAAHFDLLAALFTLSALLCSVRYLASGNRSWFWPIFPLTTAALLSKESAYCLPLLVLLVALSGTSKSKALPLLGAVLLNCAGIFAYRAWVLRTIGGYGAESGSPAILHFSLIRSLNALFFRQWALLFFPVNWSVRPGSAVWLALAALSVALILTLVLIQGSRLRLMGALAITLAASLPVEHLLLIGSDLNGARVLYLPVLGLALFWAQIVSCMPERRWQFAIGALLLTSQLPVLEHNLQIWNTAARLSQQTCRDLAGELARDHSPIAVTDLPVTWHGVYFLSNSFQACVLLNSNGKLTELPDISSTPTGENHVYNWDGSRSELVKTR
jgi:hypothetical protein